MTVTHVGHGVSSVLWPTTVLPPTLELYPCVWAWASVLTFYSGWSATPKGAGRGNSTLPEYFMPPIWAPEVVSSPPPLALYHVSIGG